MLGRANQLKTVTLDSSGMWTLDQRINNWLVGHENAEIIDMKYGFAMTDSERADSVLIIYKEDDPDA